MGTKAQDREAVWGEIANLRLELADRFSALERPQWESASWCEGWRVSDVVGHLVHIAEATHVSMASDILRNGVLPDRALSTVAKRLGNLDGDELVRRLRAASGSRFHVPGTPPALELGELMVHGSDALRPLGLDFTPAISNTIPVLNIYSLVSQLAFHSAPQRSVTLVANDVGWTKGHGPEVRGSSMDLILLMANRRQITDSLEGPGLDVLTRSTPK